MFSTPIGAARLFLAAVVTLILLKIAVGFITGSISIWAQAADSALDLFAAVVTFLTIGFSTRPADEEHPFGHGKMEDIAAAVQAVLMLGASGSIGYAAVNRLTGGSTILSTEAGIGVMLFSMVVSFALSRFLFGVAKKTGSAALKANALNMTGDIISTAGVLIGLLAVRITGLTVIDSIVALIVAALILRMTYRVAKMAIGGLLDSRLPVEEEAIIHSCIREMTNEMVDYHDIRTRKSGNQRFIDLHVTVPKDISVEEAHNMCDRLEKAIENRLPHSSITIHIEPCDVECVACRVSPCSVREGARSGGASN